MQANQKKLSLVSEAWFAHRTCSQEQICIDYQLNRAVPDGACACCAVHAKLKAVSETLINHHFVHQDRAARAQRKLTAVLGDPLFKASGSDNEPKPACSVQTRVTKCNRKRPGFEGKHSAKRGETCSL